MAKRPTTPQQITAALWASEGAVRRATKAREECRRRKQTKARRAALEAALAACEVAAAPLRSYIGLVAWQDIDIEHELAMKAAIAALAKERRLLKRMLAR